MRAKTTNNNGISVSDMLTVDTQGLQQLTDSGRATAVKIGTSAGARIQIGKRVMWSVPKIRQYLDSVSE